ncbi:lysophospholipid acyltransferase family protein [Skermania piniformis]|uniref:1-acyl-sn-glycerol-3-phosphate acyltransferase n=1 Tax=Skermania pinensis TaxID=39122 RepID=A0ABX8S878_9ACTN|nr:lysophospholipid acyltransferase family protein [Skermania piniformis]QXQ14024.1 1-acyl-sn-glycerol-3-phosphate acyltransferase [Skermania piniformis]
MEPVYRTLIGLARVSFLVQGLKFTVTGAENIPATGGAVIAINHTGYTEFIYAHIPARKHKRYIRYMAKKDVFDNPVSGPLMRALRHIEVDRQAGADSYRNAVAALRDGELVGVYPEATISRSFELKEFKSGTARMAIEAQVPIIPVVTWGGQRVWTKGHPRRLGRTNTPISVAVGAPIPPDLPTGELTARLKAAMQALLDQVQRDYEHEPGSYWVPARLGGTAPTLEQANVLDLAEARERSRRARHN